MPVIQSQISPSSDAFRANAERMRELVADIPSRRRQVEQRGGSEEARERHTSRGKLLPRDRLAQLLDAGSPFLEIGQFAAWGMYGDDIASAGMMPASAASRAGGAWSSPTTPTVKGGTYYPLTVKKHLRAQEIAQREQSALRLSRRFRRRQPAQPGRGVSRPRAFRPHLLQSGQHVGAGHSADRLRHGLCTAGGAYVPAMSDEP
jgi:3-methylcrotonyl-CoA carboxylase beta subunit